MTTYSVTIDRDACDGIFACLTRDPRFVEDDDGLATFDPAEEDVQTDAERVVGTFDDERVDDARQAAAACPLDAIEVELVGGESP